MTVVELSKLYGHPVSVKLLSGQFIYGNFYTVDPNTRSIILAQHFRNGKILILTHLIVLCNRQFIMFSVKRNLVKWLKENTIDVDEEADGTLVVFGSVRIQKPYTSKSCYCSVPLILNRICRLIEAMPSE
uniref:Gemin6_C domain-containing protein n=1 Tax=Syphacia muris TaxID=451379 RepID=A0A0N5AI80_9BILA